MAERRRAASRQSSSARQVAGAADAAQAEERGIHVLPLTRISAPRYDFTIRRQSAVEHLREKLESGSQIPPVMVAKLGGRYYPFAGFPSLEAYKALARDVPCMVHAVDSHTDVLALHVAREQNETMHPIRFLDGLRELSENGADMTVVPEEYRSFGSRPILLTAAARKMLDAFLVEVGEQYDLGGEWTHVIEAISRLKKDAQVRAVGEIISYVKVQKQKRPIPPDLFSLRRIIDAYGSERLQKIYPEDTRYGSDEEDDGVGGGNGRGGGAAGGPGGGASAAAEAGSGRGSGGRAAGGGLTKAESVIVSSESRGEMPLLPSPVPASLTHTCDCGQEFLVSVKNATVRRLRPTKDNVLVLDSDEGQPIYAIPRNGAEFLELAIQPSLRFYHIGGEKTEDGDRGHTLIITKRSISKSAQAAIRRIIEGKDAGGGGGGGGGNGGKNGKNGRVGAGASRGRRR